MREHRIAAVAATTPDLAGEADAAGSSFSPDGMMDGKQSRMNRDVAAVAAPYALHAIAASAAANFSLAGNPGGRNVNGRSLRTLGRPLDAVRPAAPKHFGVDSNERIGAERQGCSGNPGLSAVEHHDRPFKDDRPRGLDLEVLLNHEPFIRRKMEGCELMRAFHGAIELDLLVAPAFDLCLRTHLQRLRRQRRPPGQRKGQSRKQPKAFR